MRRLALSVLLIVTVLAPSAYAEKATSLEKSGDARVGKEAPWFSGWTPDNRVLNRTRIVERAGRVHLLLFFATWCEPCEKGLRGIEGRRDELREADIDLVLVDYKEDAETVLSWLRARGLGGEAVLIDRFGQVARAFGAESGAPGEEKSALPRTVVLDGAGTVRAIYSKEGGAFVDTLLAAAARLRPVATK